MTFSPDKVEGIVLISEPSTEWLNNRQLVAYKSHRKKLIRWLDRYGHSDDSEGGYAHDTAKNYASIIDKFHRWAWEHRGGYTLDLSHEDADEYLEGMKYADHDYSKSHLHNVKLSLMAYFRFNDNEWDCEITVKSPSGAKQPHDYVSLDERDKLREASLEFGTVPAYASLTPEKRTEWKKHLARRFGKTVNEVSPEDWKRANGFKYPSIIHTSLDAALRPIEVARAQTYWVDLENEALRIPEKDSSKNDDNWTVSLTQETTEYLARWLEERELYAKYDDTDDLWLTRHDNPYGSSALAYLLDELCEIGGIERDISYYTIRHSTATHMAREEDLAAAQSQLRHKSVETTMKYDNVSLDDRRNALDNM